MLGRAEPRQDSLERRLMLSDGADITTCRDGLEIHIHFDCIKCTRYLLGDVISELRCQNVPLVQGARPV